MSRELRKKIKELEKLAKNPKTIAVTLSPIEILALKTLKDQNELYLNLSMTYDDLSTTIEFAGEVDPDNIIDELLERKIIRYTPQADRFGNDRLFLTKTGWKVLQVLKEWDEEK